MIVKTQPEAGRSPEVCKSLENQKGNSRAIKSERKTIDDDGLKT